MVKGNICINDALEIAALRDQAPALDQCWIDGDAGLSRQALYRRMDRLGMARAL